MQFADNLSDRQAADAVRGCIDWKYALALDLEDPGFHYSVLSKFRTRLTEAQAESLLLGTLLERLQSEGWLKSGGCARTDSTHVLAAIRTLNRLENVGETLRAVLNDLAVAAPDWVRRFACVEWVTRYGKRVEQSRLPDNNQKRYAYAEQIGADGLQLLRAIYDDPAYAWLGNLPSVEILRQTWVHQFYNDEDGQLRWRQPKDLPPPRLRTDSPYDPEARYGNKGSVSWAGYKVHLTETCDAESPHLITHVETTAATTTDVMMTKPIQQALVDKALAPDQHIVDGGYVDAELLVESRRVFDIELVGPVRNDISWQARDDQAYDLSQFQIHWDAKQVSCPQGHQSSSWGQRPDRWGNEVIHVKFSNKACGPCPERSRCTKAKSGPRHLALRPQQEHEALQDIRQRQVTPEWKAIYNRRAGVEGTMSQGVQAFGLRACRYIGLAKTRLQHMATAAAVNIDRLAAWLDGQPHANTRVSRFAALCT